MPIFTLAFLLGDIFLQTFSQLPNTTLIFILLILSVVFSIIDQKCLRYSYLPFAFVLGLAWSTYYASNILAWGLQNEMESKPLVISGYISSLPQSDQWGARFEFKINELQFQNKIEYPNAYVRLSWKINSEIIKLRVGDKWHLHVKLKRIHGIRSPGAFDFEAWALQKAIRANGYVIANTENRLISHHIYKYPIARFRQYLQIKIHELSPKTPTSHWLMSLIIGERQGISQEDWRILRNTGTNHLMAIAGLHIGIIAGFMHLFVSWIWRRIPRLVLFKPAAEIGACASLFIAFIYSEVSGFSIPAQRACLMLSIIILATLSKRVIQSWTAWSLALLIVLLINPLSILTESFWLSFCTLALIIIGMQGRLSPSGVWWKWGRVQWVIAIGLIPITLFFYQEFSLVSFIANSIAIPWLGFAILPFCFLSSIILLISPQVAHLLLLIADKSLASLWKFLAFMANMELATWHVYIPSIGLFFLMMVGFCILLLPAGVRGKWIGIIWILPVILNKPLTPNRNDFWLTILDVGQGLAIVVQTKNHLMIYDAGPNYNGHMDMGEDVIIPYLKTQNIKKIDKLIISHGDNDHIGGAQALIHAFPINEIQTSVPEKFKINTSHSCLAGESWKWDNVNFTFLYPNKNQLHLGNDSSCVLKINNRKHAVLLTGDIEKSAEKYLVSQNQNILKSDILIVPHHGSKTSGLAEFIALVHPKIVVYAIGYKNRYHFPHPNIFEAYKKINSIPFDTVTSGAIIFKITNDNELIDEPEKYRVIHKKYWNS